MVLTTTQAATLTGVSPSMIRKWVDMGILGKKLPGSSHRRIIRKELQEFCQSHHIPFLGDNDVSD